jgi:hypothetical protein
MAWLRVGPSLIIVYEKSKFMQAIKNPCFACYALNFKLWRKAVALKTRLALFSAALVPKIKIKRPANVHGILPLYFTSAGKPGRRLIHTARK